MEIMYYAFLGLMYYVLPSVYSETWPEKPCSLCSCESHASSILDLNRPARIVNCSNLGLKEFPENLPPDLDLLDLSDNALTSVPADRVNKLIEIRALVVNNNKIASLQNKIFANSPKLQKLSLGGNKLRNISSNVFSGLRYLNEITGFEVDVLPGDIFHNLQGLRDIEVTTDQPSLQENLFERLSKMNSISLTANKVRGIPTFLFVPTCRMLRSLEITAPLVNTLNKTMFAEGYALLNTIHINGLNYLPAEIFDGVPRLQELQLVNMGSVQKEVFMKLTNLLILDLSNNNINSLYDEINWFENLIDLKFLNLSNNNLAILETRTFKGLDYLESLDLSDNVLTRIESDTLQPFKDTLQHLDLHGNKLNSLEEVVFRGLVVEIYLDLSRNELSNLPKNVFRDLTMLKTLDLNGNAITNLDPDTFKNLQELTQINLANNNLRVIPGDLLRSNLNLQSIDLSGNKVMTIPALIFDNKKMLETVSLAGLPLYCDCGVAIVLYRQFSFDDNATCSKPDSVAGRLLSGLYYTEICTEAIGWLTPPTSQMPHTTTVAKSTIKTIKEGSNIFIPGYKEPANGNLVMQTGHSSNTPTECMNPTCPPPPVIPPSPPLSPFFSIPAENTGVFIQKAMVTKDGEQGILRPTPSLSTNKILPENTGVVIQKIMVTKKEQGISRPEPTTFNNILRDKPSTPKKAIFGRERFEFEDSSRIYENQSFQILVGSCVGCIALAAVGLTLFVKYRRSRRLLRQRRVSRYRLRHNDNTNNARGHDNVALCTIEYSDNNPDRSRHSILEVDNIRLQDTESTYL